jgi:hypothetical protein
MNRQTICCKSSVVKACAPETRNSRKAQGRMRRVLCAEDQTTARPGKHIYVPSLQFKCTSEVLASVLASAPSSRLRAMLGAR